LLRDTPFISNAPLWLKYLLVSVILSLALVLFDILFKKRWKKRTQAQSVL
ncbi:TIGR02206 family membrane protein, partial [Burkholderia multivorans]